MQIQRRIQIHQLITLNVLNNVLYEGCNEIDHITIAYITQFLQPVDIIQVGVLLKSAHVYIVAETSTRQRETGKKQRPPRAMSENSPV